MAKLDPSMFFGVLRAVYSAPVQPLVYGPPQRVVPRPARTNHDHFDTLCAVGCGGCRAGEFRDEDEGWEWE